MVRNFPTHGQQSAAQGSPTNCLPTLTLASKLFDSSALKSDGPEVEHGAHFLILHYPLFGFRYNAQLEAQLAAPNLSPDRGPLTCSWLTWPLSHSVALPWLSRACTVSTCASPIRVPVNSRTSTDFKLKTKGISKNPVHQKAKPCPTRRHAPARGPPPPPPRRAHPGRRCAPAWLPRASP